MSLALQNNNPGNLKDPATGGFRKFNSPEEGYTALMNDLQAKVTGTSTTGLHGGSTLYEFAQKYAPSSDNNDPAQYTVNLANTLKVRPDTKLSELQNRIPDFAHAIATNEDSNFVKQYKLNIQQQPQQETNDGYSTFATIAPTTDQTKVAGVNNIPNKDTLGGQLAERVNELSKSAEQVSSGISGVLGGNFVSGGSNITSGLLHVVGSGAGGVGDIVNKLIEQIPGVKQAGDYLGEKASNYAETDGGKELVKSMQDFSAKNPKLSQGLGDVFNIVTAIPILRGLGAIKEVVLDSASQALKKTVEKTANDAFTKTAASTVTGRKALKLNPDAISTIIKERAIPDVVDGKYNTKEAFDNLSSKISDIENNALQPALAKANLPGTESRIPLAQYEKQAILDAQDELKSTEPIKDYFARIRTKYGDYPTLNDMNEAKRTVANNITEAGFNSSTYTTDKIVRSALQSAVEDGARALGLPDVGNINQMMAELIKAQNMLKHLEGKRVETGLIGNAIQTGATGGAAALGTAAGFSPETAAFMGYRGGGAISKKLSGITTGVLKRTEKGAAMANLKKAPSKIYKAVEGALSQKINNAQNDLANERK